MTLWNETLALMLLGASGNHADYYEIGPDPTDESWFDPCRPLMGKRKNKPSPDRRAKVKAARKAKHRNR